MKWVLTLAGLLAPLAAFTFILAATYVHRSWFTWQGDALSALGAHSAESPWIYNLGLSLTSTFGVLFSIRLFGYFESLVSRIGTIGFLIGIYNLSLVGVFHGGMAGHQLATNLFYSFCFLGLLVIGIGEAIEGHRLGYVWIILFVVALVLTYLTMQWFEGAAIPEMVGAVYYALFSVTYFVKLSDIDGPDGLRFEGAD